jgi:predicted RNA-binding protein with PIN domain
MLLWPATMCTLLAGYHMPAAAYPPSQLQHASRAACPPVMMPKGDGKQRRPKQAPKPPPEAAAPPPESPAAGRVSSDSQISVRKQIAYVKAYERAVRQQAARQKPLQRVKFRREKGAEIKKAASSDKIHIDLDVHTLPQLFVDGYNVIGFWPRLKKPFDKGDLQTARNLLLDDVADFTIGRFNTTVVFDANGAMDNIGKDRHEDFAGGLVRVAYAHNSADAYIEREVRELRRQGLSTWAATNDNGIATACSLHNATVVSSKWLVAELKASRKAGAAVVDEFNKRQARLAGREPTLWDALDTGLRSQLDAEIERGANAGLTRAQREAREAIERQKASGELVDRGAAARRQQLLIQQQKARRAKRPPEVRSTAEGEQQIEEQGGASKVAEHENNN